MNSEAPTADAPLPSRLGPYRVLRRLGWGSSGQVLLAMPSQGTQPVALKVVRQAQADAGVETTLAQERFQQGVALARRLHHPDIAETYDDGVQDPWLWVAMELLPGCSLERYTQAARLLPEPVVVSLVARVARALAHAHEQGVLHRDVKPANLIVDLPAGLVKLTDFGLSSAAEGSQTQTGVVLGSPAYMAPELLAGAMASASTDLYALGVLLFQLLTGRLPHEGSQLGDLLMKVAREPAPRVDLLRPELPRELGDVVARALAKKTEERFSHAQAFAEALNGLTLA